MTKNELRTGMIAETRDGELYVVLIGTRDSAGENILINLRTGNFINLRTYKDDLTWGNEDDCLQHLEIHKVYSHFYIGNLFRDLQKGKIEKKDMRLLWEREIRRPLTIEEIEQMLGYKIKIVEG